MLPLLSCLRQCCQQSRSGPPRPIFKTFVRMPLASHGAIGQKERWTPLVSYGGERVSRFFYPIPGTHGSERKCTSIKHHGRLKQDRSLGRSFIGPENGYIFYPRLLWDKVNTDEI